MTEHKNMDGHWVRHLEDCVIGNYLCDDKPDVDGELQMKNGLCILNRFEHSLQRENYILLTERAIVQIPCFAFLKPVVCRHIPHQYIKEMRKVSEMVCILYRPSPFQLNKKFVTTSNMPQAKK